MNIQYAQLAPHHFDAIISLGNEVHGENYLDMTQMQDLYARSWSNNVNASWVALVTEVANESVDSEQPCSAPKLIAVLSKKTPDGYLVGFRLTIAPNNWKHDQWCTPSDWHQPLQQVCYFKCNTVDSAMRGKGVGSTLLQKSIASAKQQNALAGIAHIWMQSPGNSAFQYFTASGGQLVKNHPNKWQIHTIEDGYECPVCDSICYCVAAEMIIHFEAPKL